MIIHAAIALCALLAADVQAGDDSGGTADFVRQYAVDAARHYVERGHDSDTADMLTGLRYFTKIGNAQPFWALLSRYVAAHSLNHPLLRVTAWPATRKQALCTPALV